MSLKITCPICGKRDGYEFRFGGEVRGPRPYEGDVTPESWCDFFHMRSHVAGPREEWWFHRDGCGTWFSLWRDTKTNKELREDTIPCPPD